MGKIVATKMILPKLLFFFRALPLLVPKNTLDSIQREINKFIWQNKKSRFGYTLMFRPQSKGGLSIPNLWLYYLSARYTKLAQWYAPSIHIPWLLFEEQSVLPYHLQGLLWSKSIKTQRIGHLNKVVRQSLLLWHRQKHKFNISSDIPHKK